MAHRNVPAFLRVKKPRFAPGATCLSPLPGLAARYVVYQSAAESIPRSRTKPVLQHQRRKLSIAIAKPLLFHAHGVQHRQIQIAQWRVSGEANVAAGLDESAAAAGEDYWQLVVIVAIAVADAAAQHDHRMIEQRAV